MYLVVGFVALTASVVVPIGVAVARAPEKEEGEKDKHENGKECEHPLPRKAMTSPQARRVAGGQMSATMINSHVLRQVAHICAMINEDSW